MNGKDLLTQRLNTFLVEKLKVAVHMAVPNDMMFCTAGDLALPLDENHERNLYS